MSKISISLLLIFSSAFIFTTPILAAEQPYEHLCPDQKENLVSYVKFPNGTLTGGPAPANTINVELALNFKLLTSSQYKIVFVNNNIGAIKTESNIVDLTKGTRVTRGDQDLLIFNVPVLLSDRPDIYSVNVDKNGGYYCRAGSIRLIERDLGEVQCSITMPKEVQINKDALVHVDLKSDPPNVSYKLHLVRAEDAQNLKREIFNEGTEKHRLNPGKVLATASVNATSGDYSLQLAKLKLGSYMTVLEARKQIGGDKYEYYCQTTSFQVVNSRTTAPVSTGFLPSPIDSGGSPTGAGGAATKAAGSNCPTAYPSVLTAIGCIPVEIPTFIQQALRVGTGLAGGVALLMFISGIFQYITSAGEPGKLKAASGQLTNTIIGLLFIIFSVLLLQVIGVNILNIPGFTP